MSHVLSLPLGLFVLLLFTCLFILLAPFFPLIPPSASTDSNTIRQEGR